MDELRSLVARAQTGDLDAYARIVRQFQDMACGYAYSFLGDFHLAEDVAQEAFVEAYRDLPKLREPAAFPAWFRRIVFKHCDRLTRGKRVPTTPLEAIGGIPAGHPAPDSAIEKRELTGKVLDAIKALPPNERVVTTLFYINGYSHKDISRFTSRPVGTIKRCLHDARRRLRKELIAMVEDELKRSRPGPEFTDRVVRKISRIQVWLGDEVWRDFLAGKSQMGGRLLLTDSKQRSFIIVIGIPETQAIQPWLSGKGSPDALDIHTALVRALHEFGGEIKEVTIGEFNMGLFYATVKLQDGGCTAEVECRPSDALNLAARCNAPVFVSEQVAQQCMLKRKDGKPMSPAGAWRNLRHTRMHSPRSFRDIAEVLQELERNPESWDARDALKEVPKGVVWLSPFLLDNTNALAKLEEWVAKSQGANHEGAAAGLLGAVYLCSRPAEPKKAIPHLEKAHRLLPKDKGIAFDLATAYAMEQRADDAFSILEKEKLLDARACGNFSNLWGDPRFRSVAGEPDPKCRDIFFLPQLHLIDRRPQEAPKKGTSAVVSPGMPRREAAKISQEEVRQLTARLKCDGLLPVILALRPSQAAKKLDSLLLGVEGDRAVSIPIDDLGRSAIVHAIDGFHPPRPQTHAIFCSFLGAAGIRVQAAVLMRQTPSEIEAVLVADDQQRKATISITGVAALSIAFTAKCPILITHDLAEKFYVRDDAGRPLSLEAAERKLLAS